MNKLSTEVLSRLYFIGAMALPTVALTVACIFQLIVPHVDQDKYRLIYDVAVNITATGLTIMVTFFFLERAEAIRTTNTIAEAICDPYLPIARSLRRLLRDVIGNISINNNIEILRDEYHGYEALIDDIDDGDILVTNTIFITDEPSGQYITSTPNRQRWLNEIKTRLSEKVPAGHGQSFKLDIIEAPPGGASNFITQIGGIDLINHSGGSLYSLNLNTTASQYMLNFVLIKRMSENKTSYIVYIGWSARAPNSTDYPSPCARIESEHLYKYMRNCYFHALTSASKRRK